MSQIATTQVNNRLTLTLDDQFSFILAKMKTAFPLLKDTDLVKMAVGGYYTQNTHLFMRDPDAIEKQVIDDYVANPDTLTAQESKVFLAELKEYASK